MDKELRSAQRRAQDAEYVRAMLQAGQLDDQRIAAAASLGHEGAILIGITPMPLPPVAPPEEARERLSAAQDASQREHALEECMVYERRVGAVLAVMSPLEQVGFTADAVSRVATRAEPLAVAGTTGAEIVRSAVAFARSLPKSTVSGPDLCKHIVKFARAAKRSHPRQTNRVAASLNALWASEALVSAISGEVANSVQLGKAAALAVSSASAAEAERHWQAERLCFYLLKLSIGS